MIGIPQEDPYDDLKRFFEELDGLGEGFAPPRQKVAGRQLGRAMGIAIAVAFTIVALGTLAWIGALVFNQLMAQVR